MLQLNKIMKMTMMTNDELYILYQSTLASDIEEKSFRVARINSDLPHRIGCSNEGYPMLFIECADNEKVSDIKLSLFRSLFNRKCSLSDVESKSVTDKVFTIIQMNSTDQDLIKYFLQVMTIVLQKLPVRPEVVLLKEEISKVIEIFTLQHKFSKEIVRGLWAELLVIERSKNPDYLIKAWHVEPEDKYDFNDSIDKIEVKSTSGIDRSHIFSIEQLFPNDSADLIIASVFVNASGIGKSIFDLSDMIVSRISNTESNLKLMEIILTTIGPHVNECSNMKFDYNYAADTLEFFDSKVIPAIQKKDVPPEVNSVHFRSNLADVPSINITGYKENSQLFNSL